MDIDVKKLVQDAYEDLQKLSDPYQHGMLAAAIYNAIKDESVELPVTSKDTLENRPKLKSEVKKEQKALGAMTPKSEELAKAMTQAAQNTEEAPKKEEKIELAPAIEVPEEPKAEAPAEKTETLAPVVEENKPENDEAYYDSDEWKNKHLTSQEMDDDWTPRMKKNAQLVQNYQELTSLVKRCVASKNVPDEWLNKTISGITSGHYTTWQDKKLYTPRMTLIMNAGLKKALYDLMQAMQQKKAA